MSLREPLSISGKTKKATLWGGTFIFWFHWGLVSPRAPEHSVGTAFMTVLSSAGRKAISHWRPALGGIKASAFRKLPTLGEAMSSPWQGNYKLLRSTRPLILPSTQPGILRAIWKSSLLKEEKGYYHNAMPDQRSVFHSYIPPWASISFSSSICRRTLCQGSCNYGEGDSMAYTWWATELIHYEWCIQFRGHLMSLLWAVLLC